MSMFSYINGVMHAEKVSLEQIAAEVDTPVYVYSQEAFETRYMEFESGLSGLDHLICYAMKANSNQAILKLLVSLGAGFDAVSGGEIARALAAGARGDRIVFAGVGKRRQEIEFALQSGVRHINVESENELVLINEVALSMNKVAPVAMRVNPDIDAKTHSKISTGKADNKFGVPISRIRDAYALASSLSAVQVVGLDMHIGSQLTNLDPFRSAFHTIRDLVLILRADGHEIKQLDLGGGLGIDYNGKPLPTISEYCAVIRDCVSDLDCEIELEPGRFISGRSGVLLTEVLYVKEGENRKFLVVDAAMNDLLRPAMYGAWHNIVPVIQSKSQIKLENYDIVGPVCESSDTFAVERKMPVVKQGDRLVFEAAGAYGSVMASEYNTRPLVPEVLVSKKKFAVIRERPTIDHIINRDIVPQWL